MKKPIAILAATAVLATGGVAAASAASGGGVFGSPEEQKIEFASDLADHLDGVSAGEVETGLDEIQAEREAEMLQHRAEELAAGLDGVSVEQAKSALESLKPDEGNTTRPNPKQMEKKLAEALGVTTADLRKAHEAEMQARLDQAVEDGALTEKQARKISRQAKNGKPARGPQGGPGGPGGPPPGIAGPGGPSGSGQAPPAGGPPS